MTKKEQIIDLYENENSNISLFSFTVCYSFALGFLRDFKNDRINRDKAIKLKNTKARWREMKNVNPLSF